MTGADTTVVIACFNYGRYVGEAVRSALSQEGPRPEVVVVDDGSTDPGTPAALDALPPEVRVVRQENLGVCRARNRGLELVETPYALVLDADDRLAPGALAAMRPPLEADPGLGFTYGTMRFFGAMEGEVNFPPYDPYALLHRHTIGLSVLMRREVYEQTGGFDPDFEHYEDWELWLNALAHGWRGRQVDAVTLEYRRHADAKQLSDRRSYRRARRHMRRKHEALYRDSRRLAAESGLSPVGRLVHRAFWGPRPMPAAVEQWLQRVRWGT